MKVTSDELRQWARELTPIVAEGYLMAADEIDRLNTIISSIKDRVINSAWSREESYDYKFYEYCNYCNSNLTKTKNKHEDGCLIIEVLKDTE